MSETSGETTMWVQGTIAQVEKPEDLQSFTRYGWGTLFTGKIHESSHLNWFHFPIPTPAIDEGDRVEVTKIFVLYQTSLVVREPIYAHNPIITAVHLWDGPSRITAFDNLELTGDHRFHIDSSNSWTIEPPHRISRSLGISVGVQFRGWRHDFRDNNYVIFAAAGAGFRKKPFTLPTLPLPT